MSNLFSCFWPTKKEGDYYGQENDRRRRLSSRENREPVYVYRTETDANNQTSQFNSRYVDTQRQSRSYPVSPERRPITRANSFEQRPSFERSRLISKKDSRDSRNVMVYATDVNQATRFPKNTENSYDSFTYDLSPNNVPRRSTLSYGVDHEKETTIPTETQKCEAEKPGQDFGKPGTSRDVPKSPGFSSGNNQNVSDGERQSVLRRSMTNTENCSPRSSMMEHEKMSYLDADNISEPQVKTLVRVVRPNNTRKFGLGSNVKPMIYRVEDNQRSPLSARRHIQQMPLKVKKQHYILTTEDGKILRPLASDNIRKMSVNKGQPIRFSVVRPVEPVGNFPLTQGGEAIVAAPMIGGGGRRGGKPQKNKPILRKGKGGYRGPPPDDYDDYGYEGNYYDEGADMYPFAPVDNPYSYDSKGYYDDGYGYQGEDMGRYGMGPGMARGGRQSRQQVYAAQMPDNTLPEVSIDKGKNPSFKKTSKALDSVVDKDYYDLKNESQNYQLGLNCLERKREKGTEMSHIGVKTVLLFINLKNVPILETKR
ncbi:uncharacterized protein LOC129001644 isoform X3 [Macrosteles quadrilineatus]|uniref:uncharacterized protein LOC129001644 isoform X3 n=1 Tax=Macrosteles quadrilineatus TaxID=74068 RepID=UPI0023E1C391|nr:uncharacterized protein LOC129001644 isoform X3 [Macrosteles quadrilineatus]